MDLLKVRREVGGAPHACRKAATDRRTAMEDSAMGARHIAGRNAPLSRLPNGRSNRFLTQVSDSLRGAQALSTTARTPTRSFAGPGTPTPKAQAKLKDDKVVSNRTLPFHRCGVRAPGRKTEQRLEPARCGDCDLLFLFPQDSRHLPFPFLNARVEVGPTVMEG